jgi:hypothetical protein
MNNRNYRERYPLKRNEMLVGVGLLIYLTAVNPTHMKKYTSCLCEVAV